MVIILDLKVIITGMVNDELAHQLVRKALIQGMNKYSNMTIKKYVDNVQLSVS